MGPKTYCMRQFVDGERNFTLAHNVKDAAKSGRPVTATGKKNVSIIREIIESDGRYTVH